MPDRYTVGPDLVALMNIPNEDDLRHQVTARQAEPPESVDPFDALPDRVKLAVLRAELERRGVKP